MIFANTNKEITLIYNSNDQVGMKILAYAQIEKIPIHDIDLLHVKLTTTHWAEIASRMGIPIQNLVNTDSADFIQKFGSLENFSQNDWLTLIVNNPDILKSPIVMKGDKIVMMGNPQDMLYFVK